MLPKSIFLAVIIFLHNVNGYAQQFNSKLKYGKVKDIEGNKYKTIKIGKQEWMAENLRTTKYNDGSSIPIVTGDNQWANNFNYIEKLPMMCFYEDDHVCEAGDFHASHNHSHSESYETANIAKKSGAYYNWYAINSSTNGGKNVCPRGWHVPSPEEWITMINFLDTAAEGGDKENIAGGKMKSTETQFWESPNEGATNSSGFSGLPGGQRYLYGGFYGIGSMGRWWASAEDNTGHTWTFYLVNTEATVFWNTYDKTGGFSVRCLRD
jgi:uncharacterized protein (TIGR02145 family)